jgi:phosphatidylserine/phosphatidylglycerophosphate/cardiolipin synthase-like enzyme
MRNIHSEHGLTVLAVAGNHVVLLGWDLAKEAIVGTGILGFAIRRTRHEDGDKRWLTGLKTFAATLPHPAPGVPVSSYRHPFQTFQWADYSVEPGKTYTYRVVPVSGTPAALVHGPAVEVTVTTERVDLGTHAVFFNRGAVGSQEYARRFQNLTPPQVGQAAYDWLSRGLVEGLESFIGQAGAGDALLGAFFEFKSKRIYAALLAARARGATVAILYDGDSERAANEAAMAGQGLDGLVKPRTHSGGFAHNKFLVLSRGGAPIQVWTGSTNLSENGIYGHSNNAHWVRDEEVADKYARYWLVLNDDKTKKPTAIADEALSPLPAPGAATEIEAVFSPRRSLDVLDAYAALAGASERAFFMTFAFGMNERFVPSFDRSDAVIRFALMDKKGSGKTFAQQAAEIDRIRKHPNVTIAVGHHIEINQFDRWLAELDKIVDEAHVMYVHTKYMLVDPLGPVPVVVVGSANFSAASTTDNDENMLMIRGNAAVADIYLGEFMRLFSHYAFRESLTFKGATTPAQALLRKYLIDSPHWIDGEGHGKGYFDAGSDRTLRRLYFSGQ